MPRKHVRAPGSRLYEDYSEESLNKAVNAVNVGTLLAREVEKIFNVPRRTIANKLKGSTKAKLDGLLHYLSRRNYQSSNMRLQ